MTKRKVSIWDILFWLGMIILILYIIAKLTGLINTPEWLNLLPLITITFIIGAFYQKVMEFMGVMYGRTNYLKNNVNEIKDKILEHDKRLFNIEKNQETSKRK